MARFLEKSKSKIKRESQIIETRGVKINTFSKTFLWRNQSSPVGRLKIQLAPEPVVRSEAFLKKSDT